MTRFSVSARGMTLIEIMVVMVIAALLIGGVIGGTGQLAGARLRRSATTVAAGIRAGFSRASAVSKPVRLVFDFETHRLWLEESSQPMLVQSRDKSAAGGADPVTEEEKTAAAEGERIVKGPKAPRAMFRAVQDVGFAQQEVRSPGKTLERGIQFRGVQTLHDDTQRTAGRAYLYFWPGGQTERAAIQLGIENSLDISDTLTLMVSPLTGKVTTRAGLVDLPAAREEATDNAGESF